MLYYGGGIKLKASNTNNTIIGVGHKCTCSEHRSLQAATTGFWNTPKGILQSIDTFAQDFMFLNVNNAFRMIAPSNGVKWMHWVDSEDDRECDVCIEKAHGGNNGYYKINWFMPKIPQHFNCRCQWELVFGDPF